MQCTSRTASKRHIQDYFCFTIYHTMLLAYWGERGEEGDLHADGLARQHLYPNKRLSAPSIPNTKCNFKMCTERHRCAKPLVISVVLPLGMLPILTFPLLSISPQANPY